MTLVPEELKFSGSKEMSMYFVKDFNMNVETMNRLSCITGSTCDGNILSDLCFLCFQLPLC